MPQPRSRASIGLLLGAIALSFLFPLAAPAGANHPGNTCLDVDPERGNATVGGPPAQTITATLRSVVPTEGTDEDACQGAPVSATSTLNIDFEITGPNDFDGNTPTTPDLTCDIAAGDSVCQPRYHGQVTGTDTIRGWIDHDDANNTFNGDAGEGQDDVFEPGTGDASCPQTPKPPEPDCTDVIELTWNPGAGLDCDDQTGPRTEEETNPPGTSETYTCTVRNADGTLRASARVYGENENGVNDPDPPEEEGATHDNADYTCITPSDPGTTGQCQIVVPAAENELGTAEICFWFEESGPPANEGSRYCAAGDTTATPVTPPPGSTAPPEHTLERAEADGSDRPNDNADQVEKTWAEAGPQPTAQFLDCAPESDTNPTGTQHQITCTAQTSQTQTATNAQIDMEFIGANDPDNSESYDRPDATCATNQNGQCTFTHGTGGTGSTASPGTTTYIAWIDSDNNNNTVERDQNEGVNEGTTQGARSEPDNTDVVQKQWTSQAQPGLNCEPETGLNQTGTAHTVTCTARNQQGQTVTANVDIEATGANDPDGTNSPTSPDFTCSTGTTGSCTFTHGPGGTGTTTQAGTTTYRAWIDADNNNATTGESDQTEGRNEATQPGAQAEPDNTDVVEKTWQAGNQPPPTGQAFSLQLTPDEATNEVNTNHTFVARVTDVNGQPVSGNFVDWETSGVGNFVSVEQTTDANGQAEAVVRAQGTGDQRITASANDCATGGDCTDTSVKHWVRGDGGGGDRCDIEGTPGRDILEGTGAGETICGFGGDDVLRGRGGGDVLLGGPGDDTLRGGGGSDTLRGGGGNDIIRGSGGGDLINGGGGHDLLVGGRGNDEVRGGRGNDSLRGGGGRDRLLAGRGRDSINGGGGRDRCRGGPGRDAIANCER